MHTHQQALVAVTVAVLASMLSGCAVAPGDISVGNAATPGRYASALAHPERLKAATGAGDAMHWEDPAIDFRDYREILIEPIQVQLARDSPPIDPLDLELLTQYFHRALVQSLDPPYTVVDRPGRGVLRVQAILVGLVATKPEVTAAMLLVPYSTIADLVAGAAAKRPVGSPPYLGTTAIAVEFMDGESNAVVAEYAETRFGRKFVLAADHSLAVNIADSAKTYRGAYSTWAYAEQAFDAWSHQLRARLDEISRHE